MHRDSISSFQPSSPIWPVPYPNRHGVVSIRTVLLLRPRSGGVLSLLNSLHSTESGITLVEDGVDALEESIAKNIKGHAASRLNPTVHHTVTSIRKSQILLLHSELSAPNSEGYHWKLVRSCAGWERVTLRIQVSMFMIYPSQSPRKRIPVVSSHKCCLE